MVKKLSENSKTLQRIARKWQTKGKKRARKLQTKGKKMAKELQENSKVMENKEHENGRNEQENGKGM